MTTTEVIVTEPGLYPDMPEDVYHADPVPAGSLSSTGARKILNTCPARFDYERRNPPPSRPEFDLGKAFHTTVLGTGADTVVVDAASWATKAAREARDAAYAAGKVPLLAGQAGEVDAMAAAVRAHPLAAALLNPRAGKAEQSAFWTDEQTGVWLRARFDLLRAAEVIDLKSCASADPEHLQKAITNYGYHQQADLYLRAVRALGLCDDPAFIFVFVEKTPPHLIHVVQLDDDALAAGAALNRRAIDRFAECTRTGVWPGYADDITTIFLPPYALRAMEF